MMTDKQKEMDMEIGNGSTQVMSLGTDWLDATTTANVTTGALSDYNVNTFYSNYPYYQPWAYTYKPEITLTLSEVEHLRKLAKGDRKLRKTLKKFAKYIAVEVDFPGQ